MSLPLPPISFQLCPRTSSLFKVFFWATLTAASRAGAPKKQPVQLIQSWRLRGNATHSIVSLRNTLQAFLSLKVFISKSQGLHFEGGVSSDELGRLVSGHKKVSQSMHIMRNKGVDIVFLTHISP